MIDISLFTLIINIIIPIYIALLILTSAIYTAVVAPETDFHFKNIIIFIFNHILVTF